MDGYGWAAVAGSQIRYISTDDTIGQRFITSALCGHRCAARYPEEFAPFARIADKSSFKFDWHVWPMADFNTPLAGLSRLHVFWILIRTESSPATRHSPPDNSPSFCAIHRLWRAVQSARPLCGRHRRNLSIHPVRLTCLRRCCYISTVDPSYLCAFFRIYPSSSPPRLIFEAPS